MDGALPAHPEAAALARAVASFESAAFLDWEPTGRGMLLSRFAGETAQLCHLAAPLAVPRPLTGLDEPVLLAGYDGTPDGAGLYYSVDRGGDERDQICWLELATGTSARLTDGSSRNAGWRVARGGGRLAFTSTRRNGTDFDLYLATARRGAAAEVRLVAQLEGHFEPLSFSPGGDRLLLVQRLSSVESRLFVVELAAVYAELATGRAELVAASVQPLFPSAAKVACSDAAFTRDGAAIFCLSDQDADFLRLARVDLATGARTLVTPPLEWDVHAFHVAPDGQTVAYAVNQGGASRLYLTSANGSSANGSSANGSSANGSSANWGAPRLLQTPLGEISGLRFDFTGSRLGFTLSGPAIPGDAFSVDLASGALVRWTGGRSEAPGGSAGAGLVVAATAGQLVSAAAGQLVSAAAGLDVSAGASDPVVPELFDYPSFDARRVPCWSYRPRAAKGRLPVLIHVHGGPEHQATARFDPLVRLCANHLGVAVLLPNVRGSTGYGRTYVSLDDQRLREDPVRDLGALLDWVAAQPGLDASRVAIYGESYGGYLTLAALCRYPERFRCGVDVVGLSNIASFLDDTEDYRRATRRHEYGDERDPAMRRYLDAISPLANAARIRCPVLIAHGQNDPRVPIGESRRMLAALRRAGTPATYLEAPREGHFFRRRHSRTDLLTAVSQFLIEHLQ